MADVIKPKEGPNKSLRKRKCNSSPYRTKPSINRRRTKTTCKKNKISSYGDIDALNDVNLARTTPLEDQTSLSFKDDEQSTGPTKETRVKKIRKRKRTSKRNSKKCNSKSSKSSRISAYSSLIIDQINDLNQKKNDLATLKNNPPMMSKCPILKSTIKSNRSKSCSKNKTNSSSSSNKGCFKKSKCSKYTRLSNLKKRKRSICKSSNASIKMCSKNNDCINRIKQKSFNKCRTKSKVCKQLKSTSIGRSVKTKCVSKIRRKTICKKNQAKSRTSSRKSTKRSKKTSPCRKNKLTRNKNPIMKKCAKKRFSSKGVKSFKKFDCPNIGDCSPRAQLSCNNTRQELVNCCPMQVDPVLNTYSTHVAQVDNHCSPRADKPIRQTTYASQSNNGQYTYEDKITTSHPLTSHFTSPRIQSTNVSHGMHNSLKHITPVVSSQCNYVTPQIKNTSQYSIDCNTYKDSFTPNPRKKDNFNTASDPSYAVKNCLKYIDNGHDNCQFSKNDKYIGKLEKLKQLKNEVEILKRKDVETDRCINSPNQFTIHIHTDRKEQFPECQKTSSNHHRPSRKEILKHDSSHVYEHGKYSNNDAPFVELCTPNNNSAQQIQYQNQSVSQSKYPLPYTYVNSQHSSSIPFQNVLHTPSSKLSNISQPSHSTQLQQLRPIVQTIPSSQQVRTLQSFQPQIIYPSSKYSNPQVFNSSAQNAPINQSNIFPFTNTQLNCPNQSVIGSQINPSVSPICPVLPIPKSPLLTRDSSLAKDRSITHHKNSKKRHQRKSYSKMQMEDSTGSRNVNLDSMININNLACDQSRITDMCGSNGSGFNDKITRNRSGGGISYDDKIRRLCVTEDGCDKRRNDHSGC